MSSKVSFFADEGQLKLTGTHHPVTVIAYPHTLAGLIEAEVLKELDATSILGVILQAPFPFPG